MFNYLMFIFKSVESKFIFKSVESNFQCQLLKKTKSIEGHTEKYLYIKKKFM